MDATATHVLNNRYKLLERVGSGGMAAVYKGQDLVLGRIVAVKLLHPGFTGDTTFLEKFRREAHAVANLAHPNIVTVHDIGQDGNRHYIVMEYVDGPTLKQIIRQQGGGRPLPVHRALDLTIQICAGLGYAHRASLVHCDMKPQNVLVTHDERVKVTDFGIARAMSEATNQNVGQVWGTPQYFSPEQAMGLAATPASDVYSLGVILFELLTGNLPFSAETHTALALKHMQELPPRVSQQNPLVPLQLEEIVDKVLSKDPSARYRTAGQFGRILSTYRQRGLEDTGAIPIVQRTGETTAYHPPPQRGASTTYPPIRVEPERISAESGVSSIEVASTQAPPVRDNSYQQKYDWVAITLGLIAFFALLGLIPLWYLVAVAWEVF